MIGGPKRKRGSKNNFAGEDDANERIIIDVDVDDADVRDDEMGSVMEESSTRHHHRVVLDCSGPNATKTTKTTKTKNPPPRINPHASSSSSLLNTHPHSRLPSYLSEAFSDLYSQDGLVVLGRGLGWLGLLSSFVRFYGDASDEGYAATLDGGKTMDDGGRNDDDDDDNNNDDRGRGRRRRRRRRPLVFVLNLRDDERRVLLSMLTSWGTPSDELPMIITNEAGQASERSALYARGGIFVVTSRILIVDLLQGTARSGDIDGMLVAHAERVVGEKSTEAFILRIFRSQRYFASVSGAATNVGSNPSSSSLSSVGGKGFIKAFSDDASTLVSGSFAKVDKVLKSLQVQRLFLYPRFHASVAEELECCPPSVIELHQPLSDSMKSIQNYLAASIRSCLRDLRQRSSLVDLSFLFDPGGGKKQKRTGETTTDEHGPTNRANSTREDVTRDWKFTIQQCMSTNFSFILSRQLEGDWHRLGWDVKQCISDLRTLSQLFHHLIEYGEYSRGISKNDVTANIGSRCF